MLMTVCKHFWISFVGLSLCLFLSAPGCASVSQPSGDVPTLPPVVIPSGCAIIDDAPEFYGPWQDDFKQAYERTENLVARQMLCAGPLTKEDISKLNAAFTNCMYHAGYPDVKVSEYGTLEITTSSDVPSKTLDSAEMKCEDDTGWYPVVSLFNNVRQNPNKDDLDQLIADCLVRVKLEPPGFSGVDVAAQYLGHGEAFADISGDPWFFQCWYNPLGTHRFGT